MGFRGEQDRQQERSNRRHGLRKGGRCRGGLCLAQERAPLKFFVGIGCKRIRQPDRPVLRDFETLGLKVREMAVSNSGKSNSELPASAQTSK